MSYNRGQVKALAWALANDPAKAVDDTTCNTYFDEVYARYGVTILQERVKLLGAIAASTAAHQYVLTTTIAALTIESIELANDSATSRIPLEKDDYYAVIADAESASGAFDNAAPKRWGAIKLQNSQFHKIAIYPKTLGIISLYGWGTAEVTKLTTDAGVGTSELDCTDVDAVNIARFLAGQIMLTNGETAESIQAVMAPVGQSVTERMGYIQRQVPRTTQEKAQL